MTDPNEQNSTTTATATAPAPRDGDGPDPLASLHKMSTTAGITSQEYVAINIPSIIALVLGLASVVAVLNRVLLVVPLAAVVTAVIALRQVRESNGTQTGRGFAILGILLALAIGGFVLARAVTSHFQTQADRQAIISKMEEVGRLVSARDYEKAYALFNARFQTRINRQAFDAAFEGAQSYPELGRITRMEWNRTQIDFQTDPESGASIGHAAALVHFEKGNEPARYIFQFRKSGPNWEIADAPTLFPAERPARRGRR